MRNQKGVFIISPVIKSFPTLNPRLRKCVISIRMKSLISPQVRYKDLIMNITKNPLIRTYFEGDKVFYKDLLITNTRLNPREVLKTILLDSISFIKL
jgi:hypothetical protein